MWVEIFHLCLLTLANGLLSGDLMLWGSPWCHDRQVSVRLLCVSKPLSLGRQQSACLFMPVPVLSLLWPIVKTRSLILLPTLSQRDNGPLAGIYRRSLSPPYLMASCFVGDWWHNWFSNLWDVFGIFSHASCVASGIAMSDCLSFHPFGPDWNFSWMDCHEPFVQM